MAWLGWAAAALIFVVWSYQIYRRRGVQHVTVHDVKRLIDARQRPFLIDVREPAEFAAGHIPGAINIPLSQLETGVQGFDRHRQILLVCQSGNRSITAYKRMKRLGFTDLYNVDGGMLRWPWQTSR